MKCCWTFMSMIHCPRKSSVQPVKSLYNTQERSLNTARCVCVCVAPSIVCRCLLTTSPALRVGFSVRSCDLSDASVFEGKTATSPTVTCFTLNVYRMRLLIPMCLFHKAYSQCTHPNILSCRSHIILCQRVHEDRALSSQ